jgi:hypothetical protein
MGGTDISRPYPLRDWGNWISAAPGLQIYEEGPWDVSLVVRLVEEHILAVSPLAGHTTVSDPKRALDDFWRLHGSLLGD